MGFLNSIINEHDMTTMSPGMVFKGMKSSQVIVLGGELLPVRVVSRQEVSLEDKRKVENH